MATATESAETAACALAWSAMLALAPRPSAAAVLTLPLGGVMPVPPGVDAVSTWKVDTVLTKRIFWDPDTSSLTATTFCKVESLDCCSAVLMALMALSMDWPLREAVLLDSVTLRECLAPLESLAVIAMDCVSAAVRMPVKANCAVALAP